MGATGADVNAMKAQVQQLKSDMASMDQEYKKEASNRIERQQKLAKMSQTIQQSSKDTLLVEDIVVITLASETSARLSLPDIDNPADTRQMNPIPEKVSSADEAVKIYTEQLNVLNEDIKYRTMLRDSEKTMVDIYDASKNEMLVVLNQFCKDSNLIANIEQIANE